MFAAKVKKPSVQNECRDISSYAGFVRDYLIRCFSCWRDGENCLFSLSIFSFLTIGMCKCVEKVKDFLVFSVLVIEEDLLDGYSFSQSNTFITQTHDTDF